MPDAGHLAAFRADELHVARVQCTLALDDPTGSAEVVVFNSTYQGARELCVADRILVVKGRVDHKQQGETKLVAMELSAFEAVTERTEVRFSLDARVAPAGVVRELARLVREFDALETPLPTPDAVADAAA